MKQLNIATESIAFQTGAFFKDLTLIIQDAWGGATRSKEDDSKVAIRIDQCVYKHTGISVSTRFDHDWDNSCICIPSLTRGNVLNSADFNKFLEKNFNSNTSFLDMERKGWIDPAASRVSGAFSEVVFKMWLGHIFNDKYSAEESAVTILHEVGHAFTFLQFMADTVIVNHVLQRTYQELTSSNADKKIKLIVTKAASDTSIKNRDWLQSITDETNGEVAFKLLATAVYIEPRDMDNKRFFSRDACEELADIFAVRHGGARAMLTMRAKEKWVSRSHQYLAIIGFAMAGLVVATVAPPPGILLFACSTVQLISNLIGHASMAIDTPDITSFKHKATKVRNQLVEQIKTSKLPKEEIVAIVNNIELADQLMQNFDAEFHRDAMTRFFDMFQRGQMDARASREYTDVLERLSANDLFIRAAQLGAR